MIRIIISIRGRKTIYKPSDILEQMTAPAKPREVSVSFSIPRKTPEKVTPDSYKAKPVLTEEQEVLKMREQKRQCYYKNNEKYKLRMKAKRDKYKEEHKEEFEAKKRIKEEKRRISLEKKEKKKVEVEARKIERLAKKKEKEEMKRKK
jgi:phosphoenolpyruvate synthase/pyruvate phosphate dikinase